jgi:hypothetical protein
MERLEVKVRSRERVQIRIRENGVTLAAWKVTLDEPRGAIVLAEAGGKAWYRGEGTLLGKPQAELAQLWSATLAEDPPDPPPLQLG